ncbi:MAG: DNA/RNA non-specific endonuclease [Bacteroides sp.]|nr:DNA/RNA non-specific endonuclease [Bacteroides sp.]
MAKKKQPKRTKRQTPRRKTRRGKTPVFRRIGIVFLCIFLVWLIAAGIFCYIYPEYPRKWKEQLRELAHAESTTTSSLPSSAETHSSETSFPETSSPDSRQRERPVNDKPPGKGNYSWPAEGYKELEITYLRQTRREQVIRHTGFTVSYNEHWRLPNWVGYELTREKTGGKAKRQSRFLKDPHVKGICAIHGDYTKSGYDRGHMAAAADMAWSEQAMKESFYLSNVCPQHPDLNRRKWKELEDKVRDWAVADSAIVIVCGPVVADRCETIGKNTVSVPYQFFKVILSPYTDPPRAIGFLFDNQRATGDLINYAVTVDSVERVTGLNFFSTLPDEIEELVETMLDPTAWGI